MKAYIIEKRKNGASKGTDVTFDISIQRSCDYKLCNANAYKNEMDARKVLADWVSDYYYDWLIMEDENGSENAVKEIMDGYSFEDGNGTTFYVKEKDIENQLVGDDITII